MEDANANPILVSVFFIARCFVPLLIMLGISYLLKRLGFIAGTQKPPPGWDDEEDTNHTPEHGGLPHG